MSSPEHQQEQDIDLSNMKGPFSIRVKGHVVYVGADGSVETRPDIVSVPEIKAPELFPEAHDQNNEEQEIHEPIHAIGEHIAGEGVYLGVWEPKDGFGQSLNRIFDLYAAPEDLKKIITKKRLFKKEPPTITRNLYLTFNDAVDYVAGLEGKGFHGHDGGRFLNEQAVMEAVRAQPEALESWFIPTRDMLKDYIYAQKHIGVLKGTFVDKKRSGFARWYWSCAEHPGGSSGVYSVNFTDGYGDWYGKDICKLSTRPVRAVLRREPKRTPSVI